MPTEHEYKYVLCPFIARKMDDLEDEYEEEFEVQRIQQGYLAFSKGMTTRIRSIEEKGKTRWYLTFKQKVCDRVIEIEKKLDARDGTDLWSVCVGKLTKDRYVVHHDKLIWEVDLFLKGNEIYFALAEVELEEGAPRPKQVPDWMKAHVLYEVPLTDDRFSNKRLGDVEYAEKLYEEIKDSKE